MIANEEMVVGITEAAEILGVSVSCLRNWDDLGILSPTLKTAGNHRRYKIADLEKFKAEKVKVSTSYYINYILAKRAQWVEECVARHIHGSSKEYAARVCGGFTEEEIACLMDNMCTAPDELTRKLVQDRELFFRIAGEWSAPHLFKVCPLKTPQETPPYRRPRYKENGEVYQVIESEDLHTTILNAPMECDFSITEHDDREEVFKAYKNMIREADQQYINDIRNNAGTILSIGNNDEEAIYKSINDMIDVIKKKTLDDGEFCLVVPPELAHIATSQYNPTTEKLNSNLKIAQTKYINYQIANSDEIGRELTVYVSRMMPENEIIIILKGRNGNTGYMFAPHLLMFAETFVKPMSLWQLQDETEIKYGAMIGRKLLREGSKFFGRITLL